MEEESPETPTVSKSDESFFGGEDKVVVYDQPEGSTSKILNIPLPSAFPDGDLDERKDER